MLLGYVRLASCYPMGPKIEADESWMLPNGRRIETDACCPIGRRLETDACYQMGFRIETDSLYPNQIYPNIFLEVDLKILVFPTIFVSLCFETRTLRNVWCFVQWVITMWVMMTHGTFYHMMFKLWLSALGRFGSYVSTRGNLSSCIVSKVQCGEKPLPS
jgi:hypothetical protein